MDSGDAGCSMVGQLIFKFAPPKIRARTMDEYTTLWSETLKSERRTIKMDEDFCDAVKAAIAAGLERAPTTARLPLGEAPPEPMLDRCSLAPKVAPQEE